MNTSAERRAQTLNFMQSMLLQLAQMAKSERQDMLSYLIDMAYVECSDLIRVEHASIVDQKQRNTAA